MLHPEYKERWERTPYGGFTRVAATKTCPETHTNRVGTTWALGDNDTVGFVIQGNGYPTFRAMCDTCGVETGAIPHKTIQAWAESGTPVINHFRSNPPQNYPDCCVTDCPNPGVDNHHFAPRNTFGAQSDDWPCLPICKEHHNEWHTRMDGYRRTAKAIAWNS